MPVDPGLARIMGDWFECSDVVESRKQPKPERVRYRQTGFASRSRAYVPFDWRAGYEPEYRVATHPVVYFRRWG